MIDFWTLSALLLLLGMLAVAWPLWRHHRQTTVDRTGLNVALYEERVAELDAQVAAGELSAQQRDASLEEASRLLLEDTAQADDRQGQKKRGGPWVLIAAAGVLPVVVAALYLSWGNPAGLALYRELQDSPEPSSLEEMISRMQRITEVQPQNGEAWYMLGRAYISAQQPEEAVEAFGNSLERLGERPEVLAQLAQARFFAAGNQLDTQAVAALDKALELDPNEPTALGLLGIAAFEAEDYAGAVEYWRRLLTSVPVGSTGAQAIQGGINRALERMGEPVPEQPQQTEGPTILVRLELSDQLRAQLNDDAVVFLFARDPNGPPMPLVARRFALSELPADVSLSSADAMLPDVRLNEGQSLELIARVSPDGDAMRGSHQGRVASAQVGSQDAVLLTIDQPIEQQPNQ